MKKTIITFACIFTIAATSFASFPNEKVLKTFNSTFESPREVKWTDHADCYEVSFVQQQVRASVKYDLNGNFISSVRYYAEQQLPANVLCQLKNKYPSKTVFGVTELTSSEDIAYYIKMEDKKNWITVKVNGNGEMETIEKYKKA